MSSKITFILIWLALPCCLPAQNNIDNIQTADQALTYVRGLGEFYRNIYAAPTDSVYDCPDYAGNVKRFGASLFEKADFDHNGQTDLLFNGYICPPQGSYCAMKSLVVLSFGKDSIQIKLLGKWLCGRFFAAKLLTQNGHPYIQTLSIEREMQHFCEQIDTLHYAFDNFIEPEAPQSHTIDKVYFSVFGGFMYPLKDFFFSPDSVTYLKRYLDDNRQFKKEAYIAAIDPRTWSGITGLLNAMDFSAFHNRHSMGDGWIRDIEGGTRSLQVRYDNGKVARIFGEIGHGSYGQEALQDFLLSLEKTLQWHQIPFDSHIRLPANL